LRLAPSLEKSYYQPAQSLRSKCSRIMSISKLQSRYGFVPYSNFNIVIDTSQNASCSIPNPATENCSFAEDSTLSLKTDHYSEISKITSSEFKVSEMINPDGSVTVRNLVIQEDGTWVRKQEDIDNNNNNNKQNIYQLRSKRDIISQRYDCNQFTDSDIPSLKQANSFESSNSSSSDKSDKDHFDHRIFSESAAHRLREHRLAQIQLMANPSSDTANSSTEGSYRSQSVHHQEKELYPSIYEGYTTPNSFEPLDQSQTTLFLSPSRIIPPRPACARSNLGNINKHVAFFEPVNPARTQPNMHTSSFEAKGHRTDYYWSKEEKEQRSETGRSEESSVFRNVTMPYYENNNLDDILGQLKDTKLHHKFSSDLSNDTSYFDEDQGGYTPHINSVTVYKNSLSEKIGVFVGVEKFVLGDRLVMTKIPANGKFADSGIEVGDIVISINGENMIDDPTPQRALNIVTAATDRVTIVTQKMDELDDIDDYQSATETSISSMTKDFSSFMYDKNQPNYFKPNPLLNSTSIQEREEVDDSLDTSKEYNKRSETEVDKVTRRETMIGDGSMLISKNSKFTEPVSVLMNESWKISGAIVVNVKRINTSDKPGLRIGMKETPNGRVLFVSDIIRSGSFAKTPLRIGDIILSINSISLHKHADVVDAYAALGKSGNRITIVAKKGEESLNEFLFDGRRESVIQNDKIVCNNHKRISTPVSTGTVGTVGTTKSGETEDQTKSSQIVQLEFDEESYGASLYGYNSSSNVKIFKDTTLEDVGFEIREATTNWGTLLKVAKITPRSKASTTHLEVGDAILAINGVDFRKNPNAERATSLIKCAQREVCIEYQKMSSYFPALPVDLSEQPTQQTRNFKNMPILEQVQVNGKSSLTKRSFSNDQQREMEAQSIERSFKSQENSKQYGQHSIKLKCQKVWITVTRGYQGQKVGVDLATLDDKLIVTKVSSSGLLRNAPLIPGDTILSINRVDFRFKPNVEEATSFVNDAPTQITFEILRTGHKANEKRSGVGTKSCAFGSFPCVTGRRRE